MARIVIYLDRRRLQFFEQGRLAGEYPVAIGKPSTPTPPGSYHVVSKLVHPGGILGSRWLGLSIPTDSGPYGIHGTTMPWSIGHAVSNGCIRMYNHDVETFFPRVNIGTPVLIHQTHPGQSTPGTGYPAGPAGGAGQPSGPVGNLRTYVIKSGDTLWAISRREGIPLDRLITANPGIVPEKLMPGQVINLPG